MNEAIPQTRGQAREARLWDKAPAWRNLTITATLLSVVAVALPLYLPQSDVPAPLARHVEIAPAQVTAVHVKQAVTRPPAPLPHTKAQSGLQQTASAKDDSVGPTVQTASLPAQPQLAPAPPLQPAPVPQTTTPGHASSMTQPGTACAINLPEQSQPMGGGVVIGYEGVAAAQQRMLANERANGGRINPAYENTPRAIVQADGTPSGGMDQIVVLPPSVTVNVGDRITFNSAHRDMSMPCGYIPPLLAADTGPSQAAGSSPAGHPNERANSSLRNDTEPKR